MVGTLCWFMEFMLAVRMPALLLLSLCCSSFHAQYRDSDSLQIETMMFDNSFASYPIVSYYGGTVWFEAHVVGPCADSTAQFGEM